ncbi:hypothetical protein [Chitinimonas lacunae]|uniref:Uncharacterized protein n=1 Tax=Chitinimonas lacunae TaxID=1963018 RepID=A0ABV8MLW6_9NEIS
MQHTMYYLISPQPHLLARLAQVADFAYLTQPLLWSGEEYDLERSDFRACFNSVIKVLFLDTLRRDWSGQPDYLTLFSDLTASEAYFDAHWSLQRLWLEATRQDALTEARASGSLQTLRNTGSAWADEVFEQERAKPA